jgi:hypothetical protein
VKRTLERFGIVALAAIAAFAIATTTGRSGGSREQTGFMDIQRGQVARFVGTTTTCVNPKGQIPGGQVACDVGYVRWRNILHPVRNKYEVGLTLRSCVEVGKWSRIGTPKLLKDVKVC